MAEARWKHILDHENLQRSSHVASVIGHNLYVFGGELVPREPRDEKVFSIDLDAAELSVITKKADSTPSPRVGSASTVLGDQLYVFSGRGGVAMKPIEQKGALWCYDPRTSAWLLINPSDIDAPFPVARSYHCMTTDKTDRIFVHAGCPESGRLSDLWSFSLSDQTWTRLTDAPAPERGGSSIAFSNNKVYRMNGFDGKTEQGGSIDVFDLAQNTWSTLNYSADGISGPEARSVSVLLSLSLKGKEMLLTLFGERDPSSLGHAGAGRMLGDIWLYDTAEEAWTKVETNSSTAPPSRGWFDADVVDESKVVITGGLSESNERLRDVWMLSFDGI
ncbi:hypothetical protein LTR64_003151 [Lithohypha guttulata]|uniref:Kelch repeat protein n=1 Tax=Lithohypha guttulata TaxID=1690604 RepID=A0AAN7Y6D5_9EURO|nr:hypothetical protein LTR51_000626 [Lithohypha guttulata]KAK5085814.1 hypothetical protein LTR05_005103 [Lithohypha guttulata]